MARYRPDYARPASPAPAQTLSSEAVLEALKLILIGAPLNDILARAEATNEPTSSGVSARR